MTLQVITGALPQKTFDFYEHDVLIFGRSPDCGARLDHPTVSRHHFILEANPPKVLVRDLGSRNGTYVNDVRYGGRDLDETPEQAARRRETEVEVRHGDRIRAGTVIFRVAVETGVFKPNFDPAAPTLCIVCGKGVADEVSGEGGGSDCCRTCQIVMKTEPSTLMLRELKDRGHLLATNDLKIVGYDIGCKLGQGAMGAVYLGRNRADGASVAIKVMLSKVTVDAHARKVFEREIEVTEGLDHPNIVRVLGRGSTGCSFYFVMEYCAGGSLFDLLERRGGKLPLLEAAPIIMQALDGLTFAHTKGYVHRDIKPQNILVTADGDGGVVKLSDFGLAKSFQKAGFSGMTATGDVGGTLFFMAREQLTDFRYTKPASDVWSLAATFYFLLTSSYTRDFSKGRDPIEVILEQDVIPLRRRDESIPADLADVIERALNDDLRYRFQTAGDFRDALIPFL